MLEGVMEGSGKEESRSSQCLQVFKLFLQVFKKNVKLMNIEVTV